jgi:hypothetical protein
MLILDRGGYPLAAAERPRVSRSEIEAYLYKAGYLCMGRIFAIVFLIFFAPLFCEAKEYCLKATSALHHVGFTCSNMIDLPRTNNVYLS